MKSKRLVLWLVAGSLMLSPLAAGAQPDSAMMKKHMEKMMADLKLTPDQKTKLQALHQQNKDDMKTLFDQLKGLREKTKAELLKEAPSKPLLDGYAAQVGELHKQIAMKRHEHLLQVKSILTKEQFEKLVSREPMGPGQMGKFPKGKKGQRMGGEGDPGEM